MSLELALFARPPVPGHTKTRLAGLLGAAGACALYEAFLDDVAACACALREQRAGVEVVLYSAEPEPGAALRERAARWDTPLVTQVGADLGARMTHALAAGIARHGAALVLGSDAPTLPLRLLLAAHAALVDAPGSGSAAPHASAAHAGGREDRCCIGPVADGGYILVGARATPPSFKHVRMGTRHALEDTLQANAARPIVRLEPWYDVDTPQDLRLLRAHVALDPAAAPHTAAALASLPPACR